MEWKYLIMGLGFIILLVLGYKYLESKTPKPVFKDAQLMFLILSVAVLLFIYGVAFSSGEIIVTNCI